MIQYEVKISRKFPSKLDKLIQGEYWWDVDGYTDGHHYQSELSDCGWSRSVEKAKAAALKHILKTEKRTNNGEAFGVVFQTEGTAAEVMESL